MPKTRVVPCVKVNVEVVSVSGSMAELKLALMFVLIAAPVDALVGLTVLIVRGADLPPPLHPTTKNTSSNAMKHFTGCVIILNIFILSLLNNMIQKSISEIIQSFAGACTHVNACFATVRASI